MASDLDFSPPEVPEPTFLENLLRRQGPLSPEARR